MIKYFIIIKLNEHIECILIKRDDYKHYLLSTTITIVLSLLWQQNNNKIIAVPLL